jgi:hypothetical protein
MSERPERFFAIASNRTRSINKLFDDLCGLGSDWDGVHERENITEEPERALVDTGFVVTLHALAQGTRDASAQPG